MEKENKEFPIYQIPYYSFYSRELYKYTARSGKGILFGYLLLLISICLFLNVVKFNLRMERFIDNKILPIVEQIPEMKIVNGKLLMDEPQPYFIYDPDSKEAIAIIDTFGLMKSLEYSEAAVLLTEDRIIYRESKNKTATYAYSDRFIKEIDGMIINQAEIKKWIKLFRKSAIPLIYGIALFGILLTKFIEVLIYAVTGKLFARLYKIEIGYPALIRLSVIAITPFMIISTLLYLANINIPFSILLYFTGDLVYLFFGIKANVSEHKINV